MSMIKSKAESIIVGFVCVTLIITSIILSITFSIKFAKEYLENGRREIRDSIRRATLPTQEDSITAFIVSHDKQPPTRFEDTRAAIYNPDTANISGTITIWTKNNWAMIYLNVNDFKKLFRHNPKVFMLDGRSHWQ